MGRRMSQRPAAPVVLAALVAASAALRYVAARGVPTPWIAPDEMLYGLLGRDLWDHGRLSVLGGDTPYYSLVYPAVAGLPLSLGDVGAGYEALKALQAVLMSLTAVPVFLWGRRLVRPGWALAAAALTLTIPGLAYAGLVMTEVAFFPLLVLAAWAAAHALERPTLARQALLVGAVALAAATRLQALVLVPAVLSAVVLEAVLERDLRRVLRFWPTGVAAIGAGAWFAFRGSSGLGGYAAAGEAGYAPAEAARFVLYHAGDALLLCGVVPACALALLLVAAAREREPSTALRAFVAVAASFVVWIVAEVGVFASEHAGRIEERDLIGLAPLLFLALAVWLARGAPRTYVAAAATAIVAAALVLLLPYDRFVVHAGVQDSFTFAAVFRLLRAHHGLDPGYVIGLPAAALAIAVALLPRRALPALAALVACALVAASAVASLQVRDESAGKQLRLLGADPTWVDRAVDGPTAYVYDGSSFWNTVWAHLFWNRRIDAVYDLPGYRVPGALPQRRLQLGGDGVLRADGRPIRERYVVLPTYLTPAGEQVAQTAFHASDRLGVALWRLEGTPRILEQQTGLQPNGDIYVHGRLRAYGCVEGTFIVTLLGKTDAEVDVKLDGRVVRRVHTTAGRAQTLLLQARPRVRDGSAACTLDIVPSDIVGVTQLHFAR